MTQEQKQDRVQVTRPDQSYLSEEQIRALLKFVNQLRVQKVQGQSNMAAYDIRAHLTRIFGFARWSEEITAMEQIYEWETTLNNGSPAWDVGYRAQCKLTVCAPDGTPLATYTEWAVGAQKMGAKNRGDVHDFALKTAESQALKRAAINLGDQFGLSLYNRGSVQALVRGTILWPAEEGATGLVEVTEQLHEETDPDAASQEQAWPVEQPGAGNPAMSTPALNTMNPAMQQAVVTEAQRLQQERIDREWGAQQPAAGAPAAPQTPTSPTTHTGGAEPLTRPVSVNEEIEGYKSDIRADIDKMRAENPALAQRLYQLWQEKRITPLNAIQTEEEVAQVWELFGNLQQEAQAPAVLEPATSGRAAEVAAAKAHMARYQNNGR